MASVAPILILNQCCVCQEDTPELGSCSGKGVALCYGGELCDSCRPSVEGRYTLALSRSFSLTCFVRLFCSAGSLRRGAWYAEDQHTVQSILGPTTCASPWRRPGRAGPRSMQPASNEIAWAMKFESGRPAALSCAFELAFPQACLSARCCVCA